MKKVSKKQSPGNLVRVPVITSLAEVIRADLREFVVNAGMIALRELLERDRSEVCGPRYEHNAERTARRAGHAPGELVMGGRRISVKRPRARSLDGDEIALPTWKEFSGADPLNERALEQMLIGVSTRRYDRSLEPLGAGIESRGTSRSAVSRRFVEVTEEQMNVWSKTDISKIDLTALMIDGIVIAGHVLLVALGIDAGGTKHVLGVHEGATENATSCKALLGDLRDRGMRTDRSILIVIDGGKALASAVRSVFGSRAIVQRCQVHKMRNVLDHLPDAARESVRRAMQQAYATGDTKRALTLLTNLERRLRKLHPGAAGSLAEGLDETLTILQFKLPRSLERTLATTNAIENLNSSIRLLSGRVKRWRDGAMIERWTVTALVDAAGRFRRLRGYEGMKTLNDALRARDQAAIKQVDSIKKVA